MTGPKPSLAAIWTLAVPYFRSDDRFAGRILLLVIVAIELAVVGLAVLLIVGLWVVYPRFLRSARRDQPAPPPPA